MSNDGLPSWYDAWLQSPYQNQTEYEYRCTNCDKHYCDDVKICEICNEKVEVIDDEHDERAEPEYYEDR